VRAIGRPVASGPLTGAIGAVARFAVLTSGYPVVSPSGRRSHMRALRALAGVLVWLVASLLLLVAVVLCISVLLLPVGLVLAFAAIRLYVAGLRLFLPRGRDIEKGVRKQARRWWRRTRKSTRAWSRR
jgi:hypothetical protein